MRRSASIVLLFGLCACGSGSGTGTGGPSASAAVSTAGGSATASGSAAAGGALDGGGLSAKDVCSFLEPEAPKLESVGSEVGALAQLTGDLFAWSEKSAFKLDDVAKLDTLTAQQCPQVGARVLKAIGKPDFTNAF